MNPRHTAALALVGWYLMVPAHWKDSTATGPYFDVATPLREWKVVQSFPKETDCQNDRIQRWIECGKCGLELLWKSSRCFASTDYRLKGNQDIRDFKLGQHSAPY
jgi:hypothetical protein